MIPWGLMIRIRTLSENNARERWQVRAARRKKQRQAVRAAWDSLPWQCRQHGALEFPLVVTLVRVAPRKLDGDNLQGALKAIRDEVAACLGVDDGDEEAVTWEYKQRKDGPGEYGVVAKFKARNEAREAA